ncbi:ketopantoate reductase [Rhizobiales bacterium GAS191]|nr:ketopantoate reductase [Rhizobiales bacterium GAS191]
MTGPILIWGAGAIGGTIGAAFLRADHPVIFVDNDADHVEEINAKGLRIAGPIFEDTVRARAFSPKSVEGQFGRIVLCVKALHTREATEALLPHLSDDGYVVSAQNGLNEKVIAKIVAKDRTIGCFVNFGADYLEPGVIHFSGQGAVVVGELDGGRSERIQLLHGLLLDFEPNAILTDNIWGYLWGKLVYGSLLFATALTNDSIADVLAEPRFRGALTDLAREVGVVAEAEGVRPEAFDGFDPAAFMPDASPAATSRSFADMVAHNRRSTKSHSGIWRDLAIRKRRTEAEPQLGPILDAGSRHGVPTPLTARLIELIEEIESGRRTFSSDNLTNLAAARSAQTSIVR